MKGYKIFNEDFTCKGFQYKENSVFTHKGKLELGKSGFHFSEKITGCFIYYHFTNSPLICEVEALGKVIVKDNDGELPIIVTDKIKIGRRLTLEEILFLSNIGNNNMGHSNLGRSNLGNKNVDSYNVGNLNYGYMNIGDNNAGNGNVGDHNKGDYNEGRYNEGNANNGDYNIGSFNKTYNSIGYFNSEPTKEFMFFNKPIKTVIKFEKLYSIVTLNNLFSLTKFVYEKDMTDKERLEHPYYTHTKGYTKQYTYREAWSNLWKELSPVLIINLRSLPNFNKKIFKHITGIKI